MKKRQIITFLTVIGVAAILALTGTLFKGGRETVCAFDGTPIQPIYEVEITLKEGTIRKFCSVYCAAKWYEIHQKKVKYVAVTDEITGKKIDASLAHFVESEVVTNWVNLNRIHSFAEERNALQHIPDHNGKSVRNPFGVGNNSLPPPGCCFY